MMGMGEGEEDFTAIFAAKLAMTEPSSDMRSYTKMLREMYVSLIAEGFTEDQAMHMVSVTMHATFQQPPRH